MNTSFVGIVVFKRKFSWDLEEKLWNWYTVQCMNEGVHQYMSLYMNLEGNYEIITKKMKL